MVSSSQAAYVELLDEFFERATGARDPFEFAQDCAGFDRRVKNDARVLASRALEAFRWFAGAAKQFYSSHGAVTFGEAKNLGGLKFVIGGSSQFRESHFQGVRKAVLYADTILVPDPVLPWIEDAREEERFRDVLLLRQVYSVLRMKPLLQLNAAYPAVFVFQSWDRTLEQRDGVTFDAILELTAGVVGAHIGKDFASYGDLRHYAETSPGEFMERIEKANVFVAPGAATVGEPLERQIATYHAEMARMRSDEHNAALAELEPSQVVLLGIVERLRHQYHLMENSAELAANPMICVRQQWHYHELCARTTESELIRHGVLSHQAVQAVRALATGRLARLGNIEVADLVRLRESNENARFRREIDAAIGELNDAQLRDLDRVVAQTSHAIASLLTTHADEVRRIVDNYRAKHVQTAVGAWLSLASTFLPVLGPFVSAGAPLAALGKYAWDKYAEKRELRSATRSLMGVLTDNAL